jgi:glutaminyl-peptide cyclotransferase
MRWLSGQTLFLCAVVGAAALVGGWLLVRGETTDTEQVTSPKLRLQDIPFDGAAAYEYLKQICAIGPRPSGSEGMVKQQKLLADHFQRLGGSVRMQEFRARHPLDGSSVPMANMIVTWNPGSKERILLATHYDTRPYPDEDKRHPKGVFIGANDGASGVAILMQLAKSMPQLNSKYGVDFVMLDGEEFVFNKTTRGVFGGQGDPMFLGAEYFARDYASQPPPYHYRWGVLLDMVGGAELRIGEEQNSWAWEDTRPLVKQIWGVAAKLGVHEFIPHRMENILDDHLRLHEDGKIPTCDVISFLTYLPYWHTEQDIPAHCSALSLAKVGWVMQEWLKQAE